MKSIEETHEYEDIQNPLYLQLIDKLIERIGGMNVNDRLPSERDLCTIYKVSRTTVRQAMYELELNGYVTKIQGSGTYVSKSNETKQDLADYYSFTKQTKAMGKTPRTRTLEFRVENSNKSTQDKMKLTEGTKVIRFVRLRLADDVPMMLETTYLPYSEFESLKKRDLSTQPIYDIFGNIYHKKVSKVVEQFSASNLTQKQSDIMEVSVNMACLKVTRFSYDAKGNIIEMTHSLVRPDQYVYQTQIKVGE